MKGYSRRQTDDRRLRQINLCSNSQGCELINLDTYSENTPAFKRFINEKSISKFKSLASKVMMLIKSIPQTKHTTHSYKKRIVQKEVFPKVKTIMKMKSLLSPWITVGLLKPSKEKQKL